MSQPQPTSQPPAQQPSQQASQHASRPRPRLRAEPGREPLCLLHFTRADLPRVRAAVGQAAAAAGLDPLRVPDFVLSAHELAANSVQHAAGVGLLRVWASDGSLICEVSDAGRDGGAPVPASAGQRRPDLSGSGGAGLWIVRQACDQVEISSAPGRGTVVRMRMVLAAG